MRVARGRPHLLDHAGQGQQGGQVDRALAGAQPASQQGPELIAIAAPGHGVQPVILGLPRPLDPHADLDRPAPDLLADEVLELRLERAVGLADLGRELEMPVVHRAHLHLDRPSLVLEPGLAESGHAQQQGNLVGQGQPTPFMRWPVLETRAAQGFLEGVAGVRGKFVCLGIAGTLAASAARLGRAR